MAVFSQEVIVALYRFHFIALVICNMCHYLGSNSTEMPQRRLVGLNALLFCDVVQLVGRYRLVFVQFIVEHT